MPVPSELSTLIEKVTNNNGHVEDFDRIHFILSNLERSELKHVFQQYDVIQILLSMDLQQKGSIEVAFKLASVVFSLFSLFDFVESHQEELLLILQSTKYDLLEFILKALKIGAKEKNPSEKILPYPILESVAKLLLHDKLSISKKAKDLFIAVVSPNNVQSILSNSLVENILKNCSKAEHFLRVCELSVDLVLEYNDCFKTLENAGLLSPIAGGLNSHDPLVFLNWLELAKRLTALVEGYRFLDEHHVFVKLINNFRQIDSDPLASLLIPGYISFFGTLAKMDPVYWLGGEDANRNVTEVFASVINNEDVIASFAALESIAVIASCIKGRVILNKLFAKEQQLHLVLPKLGHLIFNAPVELCARAVECLGNYLRQPSQLDAKSLLEDALNTLNWANLATPTSKNDCCISVEDKELQVRPLLKRLSDLATQPFTDVRTAALKALKCVTTQPWGVHVLVQQPGFLEYILNRHTELTLADKTQLLQIKFDIINNMHLANELWNQIDYAPFKCLINNVQLGMIKLYIKEGLWGVIQTEAAVAMEPAQ